MNSAYLVGLASSAHPTIDLPQQNLLERDDVAAAFRLECHFVFSGKPAECLHGRVTRGIDGFDQLGHGHGAIVGKNSPDNAGRLADGCDGCNRGFCRHWSTSKYLRSIVLLYRVAFDPQHIGIETLTALQHLVASRPSRYSQAIHGKKRHVWHYILCTGTNEQFFRGKTCVHLACDQYNMPFRKV
jgi:hypothetical protein